MHDLFIIGNGFDLAHDLKTLYSNFLLDLVTKVTNDYENFKDIGNRKKEITFTAVDPIRFPKDIDRIFKQRFCDLLYRNRNHKNWSDIEYLYFTLLTNFKDTRFISEELSWGGIFSSAKEINDEFEVVKKYLLKFLNQEQANFKEIEAYKGLFEQYNNKHTTILNFNYTNTVQQYLNKNKEIQLINIHGELNNPNNPMIFGFAANNKESKLLQDKNDNELLRNIKKFNYNLTDNEFNLKKALKEGEKIEVHILGHSCGISDKLILNQIFNHSNIHSIRTYYYNGHEGYRQSVINIDRIIDDYTKDKTRKTVFPKLKTFPQCQPMIQHDSTNEENTDFMRYIIFTKKNQPDRGVNNIIF